MAPGRYFDEGKHITITASRQLASRCLELTALFETGQSFPDCYGRIGGNFDGQGLSLGCLQWNFGQGTLQPLLSAMLREQRQTSEQVLGSHRCQLLATAMTLPRAEQMAWVIGELDQPSWRNSLYEWATTPPFRALQIKAAQPQFDWAIKQCRQHGLISERAVALLFDIRVQNGSVQSSIWNRIDVVDDLVIAPPDPLVPEIIRLLLLATFRAEAAHPKWREDVRARKLCIAKGQGRVHGRDIDLAREFGIRLAPASDLADT